MWLSTKNDTVSMGKTEMDYVSFGKGKENLIILPGLGDGLSTVKGLAVPLSFSFRAYSKRYKVYIFSRKNQLEEGYSTRDMAKDQAEAMRILGIFKGSVIGISQGGMIAQYLAIDFPERVDKLVLVVTLSKQNEMVQNVIRHWISLAQKRDYKSLVVDTIEQSYSEEYLKTHRFLYPLLRRVGKPKDFTRFLIQANSCIEHNAYNELEQIQSSTFVIGGECDKIVGSNSSKELADKIKNSELLLYENLGHAAYEEAKDFNAQVLDFLEG